MEVNVSQNVIDEIILLIRKNIKSFENDFTELLGQLRRVENMRLAKISERHILQNLIENESIIIQSLDKLNNDEIAKKLKDKIIKL